jgi:hypothetical protein
LCESIRVASEQVRQRMMESVGMAMRHSEAARACVLECVAWHGVRAGMCASARGVRGCVCGCVCGCGCVCVCAHACVRHRCACVRRLSHGVAE